MASWQAHVAASLCKLIIKRPLVKLPTLANIRKTLGAAHPKVPRSCTARDDVVGGIRGEWITANGVTPIGTLLYLHGGAHVACSPITHRPITSWFAKQGWRVFAPDYRLAPENRFPAGLEDCVAVYRALICSSDARQIVVAGDSAGGNLTLALCLALRNQNISLPAAIALFSPVMDFTWSGASSIDNSDRCAMFSKDILPVGSHLYLDQHDPRDPLASPYFADLKGLPPMVFHAGSDEILRDDSIRVAEHAKQAGIEVQLKTWPVVPHVWQMLHPIMPEARESLHLVNAFLRQRTKP
jgi:monoterpene epsilon-lactone hydrolase